MTDPAPAEARYRNASAISSGAPAGRSGRPGKPRRSSSIFGQADGLVGAGVSPGPGLTQLTRIPYEASSMAITWVRLTSPAFETQ